MPLPSIGPVVVHGPQSQQLPQPSGSKHAVFFKLTQEAARTLRDATIASRATGNSQSPLQVELNGSTPGIVIAGQFFPITVKSDSDKPFELYHRTRHPNPTKPVHHRPAFFYDAQIVAEAHVNPLHDEPVPPVRKNRKLPATQQKPAKQTILLDEVPAQTPPPPNKSRKIPTGSGSASAMARRVLNKNAGGPGVVGTSLNSPSSKSSSPLPSPPLKQTAFSDSPNSLRSRVIHAIALKPTTAKELNSQLQPSDDNELSEILRNVAYMPSPSSKSSQSHWAPSYSAGVKSDGTWHLKPESFAWVHPYTWPHYDAAERRRIAEDADMAFEELGLPSNAPERVRLKAEEATWNQANKAAEQGTAVSTSKTSGVKAPRKVKMKKLGDPATGGTLSASDFRGGTKAMKAEKEKTAIQPTAKSSKSASSKKDSGYGSGDDRETSIETSLMTAQAIKKRTTASAPTTGRVSTTSTPPVSSSFATKNALAPPSRSGRPSLTPPPPPLLNGKSRLSATASPQTVKSKVPASPISNGLISKTSNPGMKRKRMDDNESSGGSLDADGEEVDDLGTFGNIDKWKTNGIDRSTTHQETKKRKTDTGERDKSAGKLKPTTIPTTLKQQTRPPSNSPNPTSLKASPQINGSADHQASVVSKSSAKLKQRASSSVGVQLKSRPSPVPPPVKTESPAPQPAVKKKGGASWRSRRGAVDFTDSSEEEEEETPLASTKAKSTSAALRVSEKPPPEPSAVAKPAKTSRLLAIPGETSRSSSSRPQPRPLHKIKSPKPSSPRPLPKDPQALRDLWAEKYAEYSEVLAAISRERHRNERALRMHSSGDAADTMNVDEIEMLVKIYGELHNELMQIKEAKTAAAT